MSVALSNEVNHLKGSHQSKKPARLTGRDQTERSMQGLRRLDAYTAVHANTSLLIVLLKCQNVLIRHLFNGRLHKEAFVSTPSVFNTTLG